MLSLGSTFLAVTCNQVNISLCSGSLERYIRKLLWQISVMSKLAGDCVHFTEHTNQLLSKGDLTLFNVTHW